MFLEYCESVMSEQLSCMYKLRCIMSYVLLSVFNILYNERLVELYLVCSADEVQVMAVEELAHHISPKGEGDPAVVLTPAIPHLSDSLMVLLCVLSRVAVRPALVRPRQRCAGLG